MRTWTTLLTASTLATLAGLWVNGAVAGTASICVDENGDPVADCDEIGEAPCTTASCEEDPVADCEETNASDDDDGSPCGIRD